MVKIVISVNGKIYTGHVKIEGVRKLRFTVYFGGRNKTDAFDYRPDRRGYMMAMAEQVLREMVSRDKF